MCPPARTWVERLHPLPSTILWYRDVHMWDSEVWLWKLVVGGAIHFWESIFMHMSRVCIFSMYFRQLLRLVWLKHFKMQILPFLITDTFKALTVIKFLTISLNRRPLSPLKIPFCSILLVVSMDAGHLPVPTLPSWTSPYQQGLFHSG